ncbi:MAG TPA: type II CAAX endopeptidase family protein [Polyangia bacterium]|nr:type II CAAX endopeptidase family protein [Polyangia bacterium]
MDGGDSSAATGAPAPSASLTARGRTAVEVGAAFIGSTAIVAALYHAQSVSFIRNNLHALVAGLFLLAPHLLLRGRADIERYGFTSRPRLAGVTIAAIAIALVLPLFVGGFFVWTRFACAHVPSLVPAACARTLHPRLRFPPDFGLLAGAQLIVVALPEELFFRGYLQGRLEDAWPARRKFLGAPVGAAWLAAAALFALGHFLVTFEPQMLTRFFPGLVFGWMFARTRSILAGTIFHATCNLLMEVLGASFYA